MSTGRSKVESGTNPQRPQHGLSLVTAPGAVHGSLGCHRRCCDKIKEWVPTVNCSHLTLAGTDRPDIVRQLYLITADYLGGLKLRSNTVISCQSRSPARQAKHLCYVINVCAIETRFHLLRPQLPKPHVCAWLCVSPPRPRPLHRCRDCWRRLLPGNSGWLSAVLSHAHHTLWQ